MIKNGAIILSLVASIFLWACSMLPYKENFSCEKGKDNGMCGSVTEVYDLSSDMDELRKKTDREYEQKHPEVKAEAKTKVEQEARDSFRTLKLQEMVESVEIRKIQNETPTIFRYYLSEEEASNKADVALISENDKESKTIQKGLKDQAEKANSQTNKNAKNGKNTHLKHSNKSSSKNDSKIKNNTNKETNINKLYDGIKIYDNNESGVKDINLTNKENNVVNTLEALYEQGGWIKLKDGTYVHKSIVTKD